MWGPALRLFWGVPDSLLLRPATPDDLAFLRSLVPRLVAALPHWRSAEAALTRYDALFREVLSAEALAHDDQTAVLVAERGGQPAGFVLLYLLRDEGAAFVKDLAVSEAAEGQGVARFLLDGVRAWASAHGCREVQLKTNWNNTRARAFYERAGFEAEYVMLVRPV